MNRMAERPDYDELLGIHSAQELGIVRRYSCGCAVVLDHGRELEQPALTCDGGPEHKARLLLGRATQGNLF